MEGIPTHKRKKAEEIRLQREAFQAAGGEIRVFEPHISKDSEKWRLNNEKATKGRLTRRQREAHSHMMGRAVTAE